MEHLAKSTPETTFFTHPDLKKALYLPRLDGQRSEPRNRECTGRKITLFSVNCVQAALLTRLFFNNNQRIGNVNLTFYFRPSIA